MSTLPCGTVQCSAEQCKVKPALCLAQLAGVCSQVLNLLSCELLMIVHKLHLICYQSLVMPAAPSNTPSEDTDSSPFSYSLVVPCVSIQVRETLWEPQSGRGRSLTLE
jgi:hypothetical protein